MMMDKDTLIELINEIDATIEQIDRHNNEITVNNLANCDPLVVAELFTVAHDCGFHVGPFDSSRDNGSVIFMKP